MPSRADRLARVKCKVGLGMFAHERGVRIELLDGEALSLFVDTSQVHVSQEPCAGDEVDGWLDVTVLGARDGCVLIDLPHETFTTGTRVYVPESLVRIVS